jgi:hypothetical protein
MSGAIEEIRSHLRRKDAEKALSLIDVLGRAEGFSPSLLVLRAAALQLSDGASLDDVEATLLRAIEIDDRCVDAYMELGWFRLNVLDDAHRAEQNFRKAGEILQEWNAEFVRGALACAEELCPNRSQGTLSVELRDTLLKQTELVSP